MAGASEARSVVEEKVSKIEFRRWKAPVDHGGSFDVALRTMEGF